MIRKLEKAFFNLHEIYIVLIFGVVTITTLFFLQKYYDTKVYKQETKIRYAIVVEDKICQCNMKFKSDFIKFDKDYVLFKDKETYKFKKSSIKSIYVENGHY